ncbi:MAG: FAD-dependent oxidoreductase [Tahibacter sp.]
MGHTVSFDVLIVGGGIIGCVLADRLARSGVAVALVERDCIGGAATAASMGHLVVLDDDPAELALSAWSCERWRSERDDLPSNVDYRATGTLWIARDADEFALAEAKCTRLGAANVASTLLDGAALHALEPALRGDLAGALRVTGDGVVYPPLAALHFARRAQAHGAQIVTGVAVDALQEGTVRLADGRELHAGAIVLATGCAAPDLLRCVPIRKRKGHLLITTRSAPLIAHQLVELGYAKSALGNDVESVAFNVQPRPTGQLLIGSTRQFDDNSAEINPRLLERLLDRAREFLPGLGDLQALRAWTGFRPTTPDHRPLIGAWPGKPGLWIACGHEGLGVTTAPGTAELLAALLGLAPLPFDPAPFSPARYAPELPRAA